ncbi:MAG TPA: hypothetical protein VF349_04045, partial [Candidatus Limnocylindrales bacterium]
MSATEAPGGATGSEAAPGAILAELEAGRARAAYPDSDAPGGWRVNPEAQAAILELFADRETRTWDLGG